jgi:hypothetical protein
VQVLASIDKDGKLVIKTAVSQFRGFGGGAPALPLPPVPAGAPPGFPGGGGAAGAGAGFGAGQMTTKLRTQTYDLDDVQVIDTKGKKVDPKELTKLLKEETVALASLHGRPVDPLHLRVIKDGTLIFVLPAPKATPGFPGGAVLPGLPVQPGAIPPGVGGAAGGSGAGAAPTVPPPPGEPSKP